MRTAIIIIIVIALVIGIELYSYSKKRAATPASLLQQIQAESIKLGLKQDDINAIMTVAAHMPVKDLQVTLAVLQGFNSGNINDDAFISNLVYIQNTYNLFN